MAKTKEELEKLFSEAAAKCKALEVVGLDPGKAGEKATEYIMKLTGFVDGGLKSDELKAELAKSHTPNELVAMLDDAHNLAEAEKKRNAAKSFLSAILPLLVEVVSKATWK